MSARSLLKDARMALTPALGPVFDFGPFRLEVAERRLLRDGAPVPLTPKAFDVLLALVQHPGRLLEKNALLQIVWPETFVEENNLADNISRVRKALRDGEHGQRYIETVPRRGYRFVAEVRRGDDEDERTSGSVAPLIVVEDAPHVAALYDASARPRRYARIARAALLGGGLLLVAAAPWLYFERRTTAAINELQFKGDFYATRWSEAEIRQGIEYYNRAIAIDPNAVGPYSGLAAAWIFLSDLHVSPREAMPRARAAAVSALRRDEAFAQAHISLGVIKLQYDWDYAGAEREFRRAMQLEPDETIGHLLRGWLLIGMGRLPEAQAEMQHAVEQRPSSVLNLWGLGLSFYFARQYEPAIEQYRRAIAVDPRSYWAHLSLGWAYERQGRFADALAEIDQARRAVDTPQAAASLVHAQAAAGRRAEAEATLAALVESTGRRYVSPYDLAIASAGLGDRTATFGWLEKAREERSGWLPLWLKVDPAFEELHADPRFHDLLKRVGHTP
jgi:DNA-binding winged helix-turn-helix (wHTH) protein/Flp pilus assembly protein TadD